MKGLSSPLVLAALLGVAVSSCGGSPAPGRQNVILISLDTCRADRMGFLGAERATPRLDAFAEESAVFTDCHAQSSATAPSHLSILTGHNVQRHGLMKNGERSVPAYTLASVLKELGYQTAAFTGHGSLQGKFGHGVGFDVFISWHLGDQPADAEGAAPYQRYIAEAIEEGVGFLDYAAERGPFFLFVHGYDPHLPFWPKEPLRSEYAGWYDGELDISKVHKRTQFHPIIEAGLLGPEEKAYVSDLYDAEIQAADEAIGAFFDELEKRGLLEDSLIVYTSDHGELLGEHEWVGHGLFYEEVLKVPLAIRFPGGKWAGRYDAPVEHLDILPTVLGYLGVPIPEGVQGLDLTDHLRGDASVPEDRMRIGRRAGDVALAFGDAPDLRILFKQTASGFDNFEIYDLASDPEQADNLGATDVGRERYRSFIERYVAWQRANAPQDRAYRGAETDIQDEDKDMLKALGYMGDDE